MYNKHGKVKNYSTILDTCVGTDADCWRLLTAPVSSTRLGKAESFNKNGIMNDKEKFTVISVFLLYVILFSFFIHYLTC